MQVREQGQQKAEVSHFSPELQNLVEQAKQQGLGARSKMVSMKGRIVTVKSAMGKEQICALKDISPK